jgi:pseudaminic acid biosynthesis-associated methylase
MKELTEQEIFWKGPFTKKYIKRNKDYNRIPTIGKDLLENKINIESVIELGANIGLNLDALKKIYTKCETYGIEINKDAFKILKRKHKAENKSILNFNTKKTFDLVLISGVLIHQDPSKLNKIYSLLNKFSKKYIYINEYFNPSPVELVYHGYKNKLFKRDFAKELWSKFPKLELVNYGFHWKEDPFQKGNYDNANWFIFKKNKN